MGRKRYLIQVLIQVPETLASFRQVDVNNEGRRQKRAQESADQRPHYGDGEFGILLQCVEHNRTKYCQEKSTHGIEEYGPRSSPAQHALDTSYGR